MVHSAGSIPSLAIVTRFFSCLNRHSGPFSFRFPIITFTTRLVGAGLIEGRDGNVKGKNLRLSARLVVLLGLYNLDIGTTLRVMSVVIGSDVGD